MKQTTEHAFESYVEELLLGGSGWVQGSVANWNKETALFPNQIIDFLQATQSKVWQELKAQHGDGLAAMVMASLSKELDVKGSLHVLRHGFKFYGKLLRLAYFKPAHKLNPEVLALYEQNQLCVTRQVPCHPSDHSTCDMVLSLNGVPVATIELKNAGTGQTWRNAVGQYKRDRDPRAVLFSFKKRALVHFAADTDEVYMTTRLAGDKTYFLPFNRGSHPGETCCGAGNPQHSSGYRTGYFWQDTLKREVFLDILGHYIFLEKKEEKIADAKGGHKLQTKEQLIFPRFHQIDAVSSLLATVRIEGAGNNYLIQHSAGSGKTNSISWLSHRLASLHAADDTKVFDCVIVITDRQVLDRQLQDAIYQIEHAQGVVKAIDQDSKQLAEALIDGTKIVITTLQKFPYVLRGLLYAAGAAKADDASVAEKVQAYTWQQQIAARKYAVIVDEAHSSQSGETSKELKAILGVSSGGSVPYGGNANFDDDETDWQDGLNAAMSARAKQPNLSFFAFTATPKGKTLELFGKPGADGKPQAFHLYSMRQAIEERFILDVVKNYTTYSLYYRLVKAAEDDPNIPKKKAAQALAKFMSLHPHNIEQKTEVIVEHFRRFVKPQLGGRAKAMVVTSSRLHAVRYMEAFQRYIKEHNYQDIKPLVAFSGTVKDPDSGLEYTEPGMNTDVVSRKNISETRLPEHFASPDYQVLLVANKYQTGFDQPLLMAMYVDKRLDGVQAVQTLSRLNRMVPGKEQPFVLDFVNDPSDIYGAFKPYYDATSLQEMSDPLQLESIKYELDRAQVYHQAEVESFAKIFYKPPSRQVASDHAAMQKFLQPAVDRFKAIAEEEQRHNFRDKLSGYASVYSFLSQILPYTDSALEMLYSFARFLLPHIPKHGDGERVQLGDDVALEYYRLQQATAGAIDLNEGEDEGVRSPTAVGSATPKEEEKVPLSEIIKTLNERFATDFTDEDRLFFEQIKERAVKNEQVIKTAMNNSLDKFQLGIRKLIEDLMIQRMNENDKIVTRYMDDQEFQNAAFPELAEEIFNAVRRVGS
jgi:type I restriction enzyme, R subunit